jgi:hypothetical protein
MASILRHLTATGKSQAATPLAAAFLIALSFPV